MNILRIHVGRYIAIAKNKRGIPYEVVKKILTRGGIIISYYWLIHSLINVRCSVNNCFYCYCNLISHY